MSEFKNSLAFAATSAVISIGAFVASQEMASNYHEAEQSCAEQPAPELVASCEDSLKGDQSGALEVIGYFGMIGTILGGINAAGVANRKD